MLGSAFFALVFVLLLFTNKSFAETDGFGATYSTYLSQRGYWGLWQHDNTSSLNLGAYPSAIKIGLYGQKQDMTGTVLYRVNLSGTGWLNWVENGTETGAADLNRPPLEALEVKLNGQLAENYDIYTQVFQNGSWTNWVKNGETAGTAGVGTHIDAVAISIMKKDAGLPPERPRVDPNRPMVAVTYDDGPSVHTNKILNVLEKYGAKATFFVVGSSVKGHNIETMKRAVSLGCEIGNHSVSHPQLTKLSVTAVNAQINGTTAAIINATGVHPKLFRPPYGDYNKSVLNQLAIAGYPAILWSIDTLDWKTKNAENTKSVILSKVKDGDIILMHDTQASSATASETIIPELIARGYQLVTVSELAEARGGLKPGGVYGAFRR